MEQMHSYTTYKPGIPIDAQLQEEPGENNGKVDRVPTLLGIDFEMAVVNMLPLKIGNKFYDIIMTMKSEVAPPGDRPVTYRKFTFEITDRSSKEKIDCDAKNVDEIIQELYEKNVKQS